MEEIISNLPHLFFVLLLVLANGFFVAVEFAVVRSHATKLKEPELANRFGTPSALQLIESMDLSLSATQLGITVASLVLGWYGESTFAHLLSGVFSALGEPLASLMTHGAATTCALISITILHVVIGELSAKSIAIRYPEETLRALGPVMLLINRVCRPAIYILNQSANLFLMLFGLRGAVESERVHSSGELSMLISHSTEYGVLDKSEEEMLKGIFGFSETIAREVMTPRTDIVALSFNASFDEVIEKVVSSGLSRFPVLGEGGIDDILGIVLARDLLAFTPQYVKGNSKQFDLKKLLRESYFIPGTKSIDDLLNEFKSRKLHMAIVLDEHGGVDGLVTLEDLIEEIVGDIFDESDAPEKDIVIQEDGDALIDAGLLVEDVNEKFELSIPEGEYDTVAGFVFSVLGRTAMQGDFITLKNGKVLSVNGEPTLNGNGIHKENDLLDEDSTKDDSATEASAREVVITVAQLTGNRIEQVRIHQVLPEDSEENEEVIQEAPPSRRLVGH